jgi:trimeric autotransporter adhesin
MTYPFKLIGNNVNRRIMSYAQPTLGIPLQSQVSGTLDLSNNSAEVTATISSTADTNGNYLQSGSTAVLVDDAGLGNTATYGQVSSLPTTLAGYGITDGQLALSNASGIQILERNSGGTPYFADKYGLEFNSGDKRLTDLTTTSTSLVQWGETIVLPNPGQTVSIYAILTGYATSSSSVSASTRVEISTDGGSTWDAGLGILATLGSRQNVSNSNFLANVTPTGDVYARVMAANSTASSVTYAQGLLVPLILPQANFTVLTGALSASIPSTASGNCSAYYPATTCTASANVALTTSGGAGGNTFSWTKVSGTGTLTNTTSQTVTVSDTETTSDAGATHTTVFNGTVTDSASSTATSGNCTFTGTFNRLYNPVVVSVPSTASSSCSTGLTCGSSCTASASVTGTPSGGDGSYSHSWTRVSGSTFTLTNTTSATVTTSLNASTTSPATSYSEVIRDTVTDGHSSSGHADCTVTLSFKCFA